MLHQENKKTTTILLRHFKKSKPLIHPNLSLIKTDIVSSLSVTTTDIPAATKQPQQHQIDSKVKDKDRNKPDS